MKEVERGGGQSGGLQESAERARGVPLRYRVFAHALFRQHAEYRRGHDDHAVGLLFSHGRAVLLAHCVVHLRGDASGVEAHRRARTVGRGAQGRGRVASGPCCSDCERGAARAGMAPVRRGAAGGVLPKPPGHGPRPVDLPHPLWPFGRGGPRFAYDVLLRERAGRHGVHLQPVHLHRARCRHRPGGGHGVRRCRLCRRGCAFVHGQEHRAASRLVAGWGCGERCRYRRCR